MSPDDPRTRILDAAERAFADEGLEGARVAAIAASAGVNKAMLYYYFGSKDALYEAVLERVFGRVGELAASVTASPSTDPAVRLEAFFDGYTAILSQHPSFPRMMFREILAGGDRIGPILQAKVLVFMPLVARILADGQAQGVVNPKVRAPVVGPVIVSPFIFFALAHPMLQRVFGSMNPTFAEDYHRMAKEVVFHGLLARPEEK